MISFYRVIGCLVVLTYVIIGFLTLSSYGTNWDEVNHSTRGQAYLYYFLTGKQHYDKSVFTSRYSFYEIPGYDFTYQKKNDGDHPVFSDIASSAFNYVLYQKLNVLSDFDAYHAYGVVLVGLLLVGVFLWVERFYGGFAALVSVISLVLYPLFYGESHFNVQKDIPEATFFTLTTLSFFIGYTKKSSRWLLLSAVLFGFAWGTKFNILFLPFILALWLLIKEKFNIFKNLLSLPKSMKASLFFYPFIAFLIFFASWPHLWFDPVKNVLQVFRYYQDFGVIDNPSMPASYYVFGFNTYASQWVIDTTPLFILFLTLCGIIFVFKKSKEEKNKQAFLIFLWFIFSIIRVSLPHASIYGGVRQIMEYIPAMAILSGIGATYLVGLLNKRLAFVKHFHLNPKITIQGIIVLAFIPTVLTILSLYPNESIYFNALIGGLKGAKQHNIPGWGNSLGSTYRQGVEWLNAHAEKGAKLATVSDLISNIPRPLIRDDIQYSNTYRSGPQQLGEYLIGVTHYGTFENSYHRKYLERYLNPVYQLMVDGVPVLKIWKNDKQHLKPGYNGDEKKIEGQTVEKATYNVIIKFPTAVKLTKIKIEYSNNNCAISNRATYKISKDGKEWSLLPGNVTTFPDFNWFNPHPDSNTLQYLFAADEVKYIGIFGNKPDSCLMKNPIEVAAWKIEE